MIIETKKTQFIVAGMHRTGSSMIARILHDSGIDMGSNYRKPLPENPKGFYEDEAFRYVNDKLLEGAGYTVKSWRADFSGLPAINDPSIEESAKRLVESRAIHWGWKDPRNCLTLDFWLKQIRLAGTLSCTKIIVTQRDYVSVSQSLIARGNISDIAHGLELCRMYSKHLDLALSKQLIKIPVVRIDYDDFLNGYDRQRLQEFCEVELSFETIERRLNHCPSIL